jgi:hypothetical protein
MKKRIIFIWLISIAFGALSFASYRVAKKMQHPMEGVKTKVIKADKFALEELITVIGKYKNARTINAEFSTSLIAQDGKTVLNSFVGRYVRDSSNLFVKSFGSENLLTRTYLVAVDDDEQMIFVEKPEFEKSGSFFQFNFLMDIDSLVNLPDSIVFYEKTDNNRGKLTIEIASGNYYKTELIYNIQNKELIQLNLYPYEEVFEEVPDEGEISENIYVNSLPLSTDPRERPLYIEVAYKLLELNQPVNKKWFDEKRYFNLIKNDLVLTNAYKNYEIEFE